MARLCAACLLQKTWPPKKPSTRAIWPRASKPRHQATHKSRPRSRSQPPRKRRNTTRRADLPAVELGDGGQIAIVLGFLGGQFFWSRHAAHNRAIHLVGDFFGLPVVVHLADGKGRQVAFLVEHSVPGLHREIPLHIPLAVRRLIRSEEHTSELQS